MNIVFNDTTVTLDPKTDTAILLDLPYLQRLSALLRNTNKLILGKSRRSNKRVCRSVTSRSLSREIPLVEHILDRGAPNAGQIQVAGLRVLAAAVGPAGEDPQVEGVHGERQRQLWPRPQLPLCTHALRQRPQGQGIFINILFQI